MSFLSKVLGLPEDITRHISDVLEYGTTIEIDLNLERLPILPVINTYHIEYADRSERNILTAHWLALDLISIPSEGKK